MIFKRIPLDPQKADVFLDIYVADFDKHARRKAILVIPGGGYGCLCADREGEPIAHAFIPYGYNAFVLSYSVAKSRVFPAQLIEASLAMKHIRDHAEEYNIDPEAVFVTGFSAGGHLCATLGTMWHRSEVYDAIDMPYGYNRPTGMMPIYPVISGIEAFAHRGSFKNLLGTDEPTDEQLIEVSIERQVDERAVPAFIMHTSNDQIVNIKNSLALATAYANAGKQFELHVYPDAPHGVGLGNRLTSHGRACWENAEIAKWVGQAAAWAESICEKQKESV